MSERVTWQSIQAEIRRRISEREWRPGELIPGEVLLAEEFGCARATVNRALRQLAESGLVERRRKGGTHVSRHPVRKAVLNIPIIRHQVEQSGSLYSHKLISRHSARAPKTICKTMMLPAGKKQVHLKSLHFSDERPFMFEDRWVNLETVPQISNVDFERTNANEWLIEHALFTHGDITFSAANASEAVAKLLDIDVDAAIFMINRVTWNGLDSITSVQLAYAPGFIMQTRI